MSKEERDAVYRRCISTYGANTQIDMMLEEMSELAKALLKNRRSKKHSDEPHEEIIDEIADVKIMVRQMEILFQCEEDVEHRIDFKLERQSKRLDEKGERWSGSSDDNNIIYHSSVGLRDCEMRQPV